MKWEANAEQEHPTGVYFGISQGGECLLDTREARSTKESFVSGDFFLIFRPKDDMGGAVKRPTGPVCLGVWEIMRPGS